MIDTISIRNFKSLRDVRVAFERFTVIVGPNGSGKSSVLQALDSICTVARQLPQQTVDILQSLTIGAQGPIELVAQAGPRLIRYRSQHVGSNGQQITQPTVEMADTCNATAWKPWNPKTPSGMPRSMLLNLTTRNLMATNPNQQDSASMAPNGTGLHAALASMALNEPDTWQAFQRDLKGILPSIKRVRHAKLSSGQAPELLFDTVAADSLRATQMSEGSLLVVGLLTALYAPERPNLVLLDDLDRGLHPKAQKDLVALLRELLKRNPDLQLVASTHSPYLLNWMEPSEVRMTSLRDDGSTSCAPIATHPQFGKWKDEMAPGEMWSLFGEKWLVTPGAGV